MKRLLLFVSCASLLAACDKGTDGGLKVVVTISPSLKTNCVALEVQKSGDGTLLATTVVPRPAGDGPLLFAVRQGDLPKAVQVQAVGYSGTKCDDTTTRKLASRGELKTVNFPEKGLDPVSLALGPPDATLDADRDGVVALSKGGVDCDDTNANVFPGATQACDSPIDFNCDGAVFCADAACATSAVCMRPPDRLAFTNVAPSGLRRFDCSPAFKVQSQDALGPAAVTKNVALTVTGSLAGTEFFSDAACKNAVATPTITYGTTEVVFYSRASSFGAQTLTATATDLMKATQTFTVDPQPATSFTFNPSTVTTAAGDCTEVTLQTTDDNMRPTPSQTPLTASLGASPALGTAFYDATDTTCTTPIASLTFTNVDTVKLRIRSTRATAMGAPLVVTAQASTVANNGTLNVNVTAAAAAKLAFTSLAPGLVVNTCSGATIVVGVQDTFGNTTKVSADTAVTLTSMRQSGSVSASIAYSSDASCTSGQLQLQTSIPANSSSSLPVSLKGNGAGTFLMTAASVGLTSGSQLATIANGPPTGIAIISDPVTAVAGRCSPSPIRIETHDSSNARSAVQGSDLSVEVSASGLTFYSDVTCATALPSSPATHLVIPVGSAEGSFYFKGIQAAPGGVEVTAAAPTYSPPNNVAKQKEFVNAGTAYALKWVNTTSYTTTSGVCAGGGYTLEVRDDQDNPTLFTAAQTVSLMSAPSGVTATGVAGCAAGPISFTTSSSQATLYASASLANTYALTASAGGITSSAPAASLTVNPGAYSQLVYTTPGSFPQAVVAGACRQITVERRDAAGNAVPVTGATDFVLNTAASGFTTYATQANCLAVTNALSANTQSVASGASATFWVRPTVAGTALISVTAQSISTSMGTLNVGAAPATQIAWVLPVGAMATISAGGCVGATLERRDQFGNVATDPSALTINLAASGSASGGAKFSSNGTCSGSVSSVTVVSGASQVAFSLTSTLTGSMTVTPSSSLGTGPTATITVNPGTATKIVYTTAPAGAVTAGSCNQVTVQRQDGSNNPVPFSGNFNLSTAASGVTAYASAANCGTQTSPLTMVSSAGTSDGTFYVRPTVIPSATLTISDGSLSADTTITINPATASKLTWGTATPTSFTAGSCQVLTVERRDPFDNLTTSGGTSLNFSVAATGASAGSTVLSNAADCGSAVASPLSSSFSTSQSSRTISVRSTLAGALSLTPSGPPNGPQFDFTVVAGAPNKLVFTGVTAVTPAGMCVTNTVEVRDANDNRAAPGGGLVVNLGTSLGSADYYASATCAGGTTATVTIPASGTPVTFGFLAKTVPTTTLLATATGVSDATQSWSVTAGTPATLGWKTAPASSLTRFACTTGEVEVRDAYGNPTPAPGAPASRNLNFNSSVSGAGLWFSTSNDCSTGPATSVSLAGGAAGATFSVLGLGSGLTQVTLSDATSALTTTPNAPITVGGAQGALVLNATNTNQIEYFDCEPISITRQVSAADYTKGTTSLTVSSNSASITVHSDSSCTVAVGTPTIGEGSASTTVYVKGHSGNSSTVVITASDNAGGYANGTVNLTALPLVRSGTCSIENGATDSATSCAITPAIPTTDTNRTFFVMQFSPDATSNSASNGSVQCVLTSTSLITCTRPGTSGRIAMTWQTVSTGRGVSAGGFTVQHLAGTMTDNTNFKDLTISTVTLNRTFTLLSHSTLGSLRATDYVSATYPSTTSVRLAMPSGMGSTTFQANPMTYGLQVVEFAGATVDHGTITSGNPTNVKGTTSSMALGQSFVLATSHTTANGDNSAICRRQWRAELTSATEITFTRGSGASGCNPTIQELSWERVLVPGSTVQSCNAQIWTSGGPVNSGTCSISSAPTMDRTLVLLASQGPNAQSGGETAYSSGDNPGMTSAVISLTGTTVTLTRGTTTNTASNFTPYIITFPQ